MIAVTTELLDKDISTKRLIWLMDEETYDLLYDLTKQHLKLAREATDKNTKPERKSEIMQNIERLRSKRESIIEQYRKSL